MKEYYRKIEEILHQIKNYIRVMNVHRIYELASLLEIDINTLKPLLMNFIKNRKLNAKIFGNDIFYHKFASVDLMKKLEYYLDEIKQVKGVENVVLSQKIGTPIQETGVWFAMIEIFNVCHATSQVFYFGTRLYPKGLKHILIEGGKAIILIIPLNSPDSIDEYDFFISITCQPNTNLMEIYLQTDECVGKIKKLLNSSNEKIKRPLHWDRIGFEYKFQDLVQDFKDSSSSLNLTKRISIELKKILDILSTVIPELKIAYILLGEGFVISKILSQPENEEEDLDTIYAMNYAFFRTANTCAWILKKMKADNILLECEDSFHLMYGLTYEGFMGKSIFGLEIGKSQQKIASIKLLIPPFTEKIQNLLREEFLNNLD